MVTLYEILEVSEKASKEVIDKAYRVLAKKYHPDLQSAENMQNAEIKMKQINEAYAILSDEEKRKQYDETLTIQREEERKRKMEQEKSQNFSTFGQVQNATNAQMSYEEKRYQDIQRRRYEADLKRYEEQKRQQINEQYQNAYYNYLKSLGFQIKEKWTWKKTKKLLLAVTILIGIGIILWFIPPTHNAMVTLYENNIFVKVLFDTIMAFLKGMKQTFQSMFTN